MPDWTAIFPVLKKISDQFQGRIERLKNEKAKLEEELTRFGDKYCSISVSERKAKIKARIKELNTIICNNAKD